MKQYLFCSLSTAAILMITGCSWSPGQQEVLNAFERAAEAFTSRDWDGAERSLSISTVNYLSSISRELSSRGLPYSRDGKVLLRVLSEEYIDFNGDVTMIFLQGESAIVSVSSVESMEYSMVFEEGEWRLDLCNIFAEYLTRDIQGSYLDTGVFIDVR